MVGAKGSKGRNNVRVVRTNQNNVVAFFGYPPGNWSHIPWKKGAGSRWFFFFHMWDMWSFPRKGTSSNIFKPMARWWQLNIFYCHPEPWGNDPIWRAYFSNGLVQPPIRWELQTSEIHPNSTISTKAGSQDFIFEFWGEFFWEGIFFGAKYFPQMTTYCWWVQKSLETRLKNGSFSPLMIFFDQFFSP